MREYQQFLKLAAKRKADMQRMAQTMTLRKIAAKYGLSVQRVFQIVGKRQNGG